MGAAVVLGAGGPVGLAFHAGVLAALAERGWDARRAELVVGTSVGALTGALLRAGSSPRELYERVTGVRAHPPALVEAAERLAAHAAAAALRPGRPASPGLVARQLRSPWRLRPRLVRAGLLPAGSLPATVLADGLAALLEPPSRHAGALWSVAVDLDSGRRIVLGAPGGPAPAPAAAVAASCAVPGLFAPVEMAGLRLVDGGLHSPANTDLLEAAGPFDTVVVSAPMGIGSAPGRVGLDLPGRWLNHRSVWRGLARVRRLAARVVVVEPTRSELELMGYSGFDLSAGPEVARRARASVAARADIASWLGDSAEGAPGLASAG